MVAVQPDESRVEVGLIGREGMSGIAVVLEAIALCKSGMSIDVVFTDINLIGPATGWDVAECFRIERPDVAVLYTSGKSVDAQRCVPGSVFVAKPYRNSDVVSLCQRLAAQL